MIIVLDTFNFLLLSMIIIFLSKFHMSDWKITLILLLHIFLVFFLNDVLFPASYMPDQFLYFSATSALRSGSWTSFRSHYLSVQAAAWFFSGFPVFITSITSISMVNAFLYCLIYFGLEARNFWNGRSWGLAAYLFYPSLALYSALALRDTLIVLCLVVSVYNILYQKNHFFIWLILIPLYFIKNQYAVVIIGAWTVFFIFHKAKIPYVFRYAFSLMLPFFGIILGSVFFMPLVNQIAVKVFFQYTGSDAGFVPFSSWLQVVLKAAAGFYRFIMAPEVYELNNPLIIIQYMENVIIYAILVGFFILLFKNKKEFHDSAPLLFFIVLSGGLITGLFISNAGSLSRYRLPFVVLMILFASPITQNRKSLS